MNEQERRRLWIKQLVSDHGEYTVATVLGFNRLEDFAQWTQLKTEVDDLDMVMLASEFGDMPSSE